MSKPPGAYQHRHEERSMWLGDFQRIGICFRTASAKPILSRKEMKTAIPPNGVMARCVSRRINRSSDNRAVISRAGLNCPSPLIDW